MRHQNFKFLYVDINDNIINMCKGFGFTLIEVMIAAALLSMCVIFSSLLLSYSRGMLLDSARRQQANLLLESIAAVAQADHHQWLKNAPWQYQLSNVESQATDGLKGNLAQDLGTIDMLFHSQRQNGLFALIALQLNIQLTSDGALTLKIYWQNVHGVRSQSHVLKNEMDRHIQLLP